MKQVGLAVLLAASVCSTASVCSAQESGDFKPATTNVWGAEYPRVDGAGQGAGPAQGPGSHARSA